MLAIYRYTSSNISQEVQQNTLYLVKYLWKERSSAPRGSLPETSVLHDTVSFERHKDMQESTSDAFNTFTWRRYLICITPKYRIKNEALRPKKHYRHIIRQVVRAARQYFVQRPSKQQKHDALGAGDKGNVVIRPQLSRYIQSTLVPW